MVKISEFEILKEQKNKISFDRAGNYIPAKSIKRGNNQ
jgi:hypothetical protein